ncbi:hypothetical protein [Bacillus benzoevorans]|uniref:Uncharacterized protein n=1 Tax=Bacillus benzoevorans TaxID=1456 RepID=A0A7X0HVM3_9BACI|nr:hypothetical protein [Bacillus benzoevorans]MBB6446450.1 hypothetical protein [Bacillus benzoevorans]
MPHNTKRIKTDIEGKAAPQVWNDDIDDYQANNGRHGAASMYQLGSIVHDAWSGSANATKTFTKQCFGFALKNDGAGDVVVTIGTLTFTIKAGESFNGNFEPFSEITIATTSAYRALVAR